MNKAFDLTDETYHLWKVLVEKALKNSNLIQFNILYLPVDVNKLLGLYNGVFRIRQVNFYKFFQSGDVLELPIAQDLGSCIKNLEDFGYWKNKCVEDPSFWDGEHEILACISHEDIVMADIEYFGEILEGINMYDLGT